MAYISSPRRQDVIPLAKSLDLIIAGRIVAAADLLMQRFRPVEMGALEDGDWSIARHLEVTPTARPVNPNGQTFTSPARRADSSRR